MFTRRFSRLVLGAALLMTPAVASASADIPPEEPKPTKKGCTIDADGSPAALTLLTGALLLGLTARRRR